MARGFYVRGVYHRAQTFAVPHEVRVIKEQMMQCSLGTAEWAEASQRLHEAVRRHFKRARREDGNRKKSILAGIGGGARASRAAGGVGRGDDDGLVRPELRAGDERASSQDPAGHRGRDASAEATADG
jgi:hypothetical protein